MLNYSVVAREFVAAASTIALKNHWRIYNNNNIFFQCTRVITAYLKATIMGHKPTPVKFLHETMMMVYYAKLNLIKQVCVIPLFDKELTFTRRIIISNIFFFKIMQTNIQNPGQGVFQVKSSGFRIIDILENEEQFPQFKLCKILFCNFISYLKKK